MRKTYDEFLQSKIINDPPSGFNPGPLNPALYPFQRDIVQWAIRRGRAAIFADTGLGKTLMQLEWAAQVQTRIGGNALILAPLAVANQTAQIGESFGYKVNVARSQNDIIPGINITNYDRIHLFEIESLSAIILDESSILKNYAGKFRNELIDRCARIPYRLCCTATPAPNDFQELGNHAEFLGVMTRTEMLSMFFINDTANTGTWRLKGHAQDEFWRWMCSWSVMVGKPSDLGHEDGDFILPPLNIHQVVVDYGQPLDGELFVREAQTLMERRQVRRDSTEARVLRVAELAESFDTCIVWCDLNYESRSVSSAINGCVEIKGADEPEFKKTAMIEFAGGGIKKLVTKPSIAGYGMNWQHCNKVIFLGLSDSWESYYQAVRRCWRYGQTQPVDVYIVTSEQEGAVVQNIQKKEQQALEMRAAMVEFMREEMQKQIRGITRKQVEYKTDTESSQNWTLCLGDNVEVIKNIASDSICYTLFSPPFASLFTYSNSIRDMGNSRTGAEFMGHFSFLVSELFRVTMPGRLLSMHCMNLPTSKQHEGFIGLKDFRGDLIYLLTQIGFIYHSEVVIWKDPLVAATRTKALGLAHKQISKDSAMCRQGLPDYIVTFRKPGDNPRPVSKGRGFERYVGDLPEPKRAKTNDARTNKYSHEVWQRYASPVWFDINQTRTLNVQNARENEDERHVCPLQLDVIERCVDLWTNPGDLVLDPFSGIGSTGYVAVRTGRKYLGIELKESYWRDSIRHLTRAESEGENMPLLAMCAEAD